MRRTRIALPLLLGGLILRAPAQAPPAAANDSNQPVTTIHTTARLVVLDVVVADGGGHPVKGLKPSDFTLSEDGVPQKLSSFVEYQAATNPSVNAPEPEVPPNTFTVHPPVAEAETKTVIVLDNLHYPNQPYVRADIETFLKTLEPGHPIGIIQLDRLGLHLVQDFTSDPRLIEEAVASARMLPPLPSSELLAWTPIPCEIPYAGVAQPYHRLARYFAGIPGRINLAWITDEGNPAEQMGAEYPDLSTFVRDLDGPTNIMRLSRVTLYTIKAGGSVGGILQPEAVADIPIPEVFPQSKIEMRPDCNPVPAANGSVFANRDLADMAAAVGGHAFFGGAAKAMTQIIATGSDYYTLSYVPSNPNWNGAYRKIKIAVARIPEVPQPVSRLLTGWTEDGKPLVMYRPGYFARSKPDVQASVGSTAFGFGASSAAAAPARGPGPAATSNGAPHATSTMEAAMGFGTLTPDQVNFTIAVTPSPQIEAPKPGIVQAKDTHLADPLRNAPYRDCRIHYWIDPKDLKFSRTANGFYRDDLHFVAIVYRDDGFVANSVSVNSHVQVTDEDLETILASGITFDQTIAMPVVGSFFLRTGVQETSTGSIGALEVPAAWIKLPPQAANRDTAANSR